MYVYLKKMYICIGGQVRCSFCLSTDIRVVEEKNVDC